MPLQLKVKIGMMAAAMAFVAESVWASAPLCTAIFNGTDISAAIETTIQSLAKLQLRLDDARVSGHSSVAVSGLRSDYIKKENALLSHVVGNHLLTKQELRQKIRQEMIRLQANQKQAQNTDKDKHEESRDAVIRRTERLANLGRRVYFNSVKPGTFKMGEPGKEVSVTLTKPFEMANTPITQIVWKSVVDLINTKLNGQIHLEPSPSFYKGETLPVEQVLAPEVYKWIEGLNLLSQGNEPALAQIIAGHKPGDIYRLPTEAEFEFVLRNRGRNQDAYLFGKDLTLLPEYAWYSESNAMHPYLYHAARTYITQPVGGKKPLVVDGQEFYDLIGNVGEIMAGGWKKDLIAGTDPYSPIENPSSPFGFRYAVRGGSAGAKPQELTSYWRREVNSWSKSNDLGFRLVKIVEK